MTKNSAPPNPKKIARERITALFSEARRMFADKPSMSHRYVALARLIAMRQRIRIDRDLRRQYCRHCYHFLVPGVNMRVRIYRGKVTVTCLECHRQMRYVLGRQHEKH